MADKKISQLTALDNADLAADDVLPIVDTNAVATKKITVANLLAGSPSNPNVQQADIGTDPNQVPLNQYLGDLAYQDAENIAGDVGVGGDLQVDGDAVVTGKVGIGTSSPNHKLEIQQNSATLGPTLRLTNNADTIDTEGVIGAVEFFSGDNSGGADGVTSFIKGIQQLASPNAGALIFGTGDTTAVEKMRLDRSGNLIQTVNTTAATLTQNQTLTFSIVDNSTLRISVRGSDGTTRTATVALT